MDLPPFEIDSLRKHQNQDSLLKERMKMSLSDAIHSFHPYEEIAQRIVENPEVVHTPGWHGLYPLHKAALRGDHTITKLLLNQNASANQPNNYGETALHYACKRGTIVNVRVMLEHGEVKGDVWQRDNAGRNCLHHAASGGSILAMHYLSQVHGMAFHDKDYGGQTPLHIVSLQGFQDAVKYLLRKNRSDVTWVDNNGNTALHLACINALSETCWILLQHSCCNMLKVQNKQGQTPLAMLVEGQTAGHRYTHKELSHWSQSSTPSLPPQGPLFTWYFLLTLPAHVMALAVLVSSVLWDYGTMFITLAIGILAWFTGSFGHRLQHISRWPNPVFFGAFTGGLIHTIVCFVCKILPVVWPMGKLLHILLDVPLLLAVCVLYYLLLHGDPGRCCTSRSAESAGGQTSGSTGPSEDVLGIEDVASGKVKYEEFCTTCEIVIPHRAKHCKLCDQCMYNLDHHCLYLLRCVARNNHRHFILFTILVLVSQLVFLGYSLQYLGISYPGIGTKNVFTIVLSEEAWVWSMFLLNVVSVVWGVSLLSYQLSLVANGITMVWRPTVVSVANISRAQLTWQAKFRNLANFFSYQQTYTASELEVLGQV